MLSWLVGNVDVPAAAVLVAGFACIAIVATGSIAKYKTKTAENNEFELAKMRIETDEKLQLYSRETERVHKIKLIEQNMITSHRVDDRGDTPQR